jgi:hypothetical protein
MLSRLLLMRQAAPLHCVFIDFFSQFDDGGGTVA